MLHGFLESWKVWESYIKELVKTNTVVAIDLLGHGATDSMSYVHSMEDMAEQVKAILKQEDVRRATFVGHSMGGYVSLAFAEKYPDMVRGLCLFNSSAFADSETKKAERDRAIVVVKKHSTRFIQEAVPNLFVEGNTTAQKGNLKKLLNIATATKTQGVVAALEGMKIRENRELILKFAPCPTFFVIGKKDKILPYQDLIEQSKLNEKGSYYLSEKGGHLCFYEDTYPCLNALKKWLNQLSK